VFQKAFFWIAEKREGERERGRVKGHSGGGGVMNKCVGIMRVQAENSGWGEPIVWGSVSAGVQSS